MVSSPLQMDFQKTVLLKIKKTLVTLFISFEISKIFLLYSPQFKLNYILLYINIWNKNNKFSQYYSISSKNKFLLVVCKFVQNLNIPLPLLPSRFSTHVFPCICCCFLIVILCKLHKYTG